jgi:hypothetical protein
MRRSAPLGGSESAPGEKLATKGEQFDEELALGEGIPEGSAQCSEGHAQASGSCSGQWATHSTSTFEVTVEVERINAEQGCSSSEDERLRFNQRLVRYLQKNDLVISSKQKQSKSPASCPYDLDALGELLVDISDYVADCWDSCNDAFNVESSGPASSCKRGTEAQASSLRLTSTRKESINNGSPLPQRGEHDVNSDIDHDSGNPTSFSSSDGEFSVNSKFFRDNGVPFGSSDREFIETMLEKCMASRQC